MVQLRVLDQLLDPTVPHLGLVHKRPGVHFLGKGIEGGIEKVLILFDWLL